MTCDGVGHSWSLSTRRVAVSFTFILQAVNSKRDCGGKTPPASGFGDLLTAISAFFTTNVPIEASITVSRPSIFAVLCKAARLHILKYRHLKSAADSRLVLKNTCEQILLRITSYLSNKLFVVVVVAVWTVSMTVGSGISITCLSRYLSTMLIVQPAIFDTLTTVGPDFIISSLYGWSCCVIAFLSFLVSSATFGAWTFLTSHPTCFSHVTSDGYHRLLLPSWLYLVQLCFHRQSSPDAWFNVWGLLLVEAYLLASQSMLLLLDWLRLGCYLGYWLGLLGLDTRCTTVTILRRRCL